MNVSDIVTLGDATLTVIHPATHKPTDAKITICGPETKQFRNSIRLLVQSQASVKEAEESAREAALQAEVVAHLARITVGWENIELDNEELEFNKENAIKLYSEYGFITRQVDIFASNTGNFYVGPQTK